MKSTDQLPQFNINEALAVLAGDKCLIKATQSKVNSDHAWQKLFTQMFRGFEEKLKHKFITGMMKRSKGEFKKVYGSIKKLVARIRQAGQSTITRGARA